MPTERIWRTEGGEIPISRMTDEHLQRAFYYSERRFMHHNNEALKHLDSQDKFATLLDWLLAEAKERGITLESLADTDPEKFQILTRSRKLHEYKETVEEGGEIPNE